MCDTIVYSSIRLWARAVEDYYNAIDKASVNTILPHSQCWNTTNSSYLNTDFIRYHYGKNFHKFKKGEYVYKEGDNGQSM